MRPYNGKNVLVVGLGPAGYTLAHHLACEGFGVVAVDGLKVEPLDAALVGTRRHSRRRPMRDCVSALYGELDERRLLGFGGVSEYGITVRWDKNFLTLVVPHARAATGNLKIYGGVRFGGTITLEDAWALGFDHVAIAAGAGRPTIIDMKNNLSRGIRKASDFLMALQLTGAYKHTSIANLQVSLPGGRHRRRPHRDRHGDRAPRLLPGAGREGARALRAARSRAGTPRRRPRDVRRRGVGDARASTSRTRASSATRRRAPRPRGASRGCRSCSTRGAASRSSTARRSTTRRRTA